MSESKRKLQCISPVDGSVYVEREVISKDQAISSLERAREAQKIWRNTSLDERIAVVLKCVENLGDKNDEIVPELAHMMGRPVRYGGEFGGVQERTDYMTEIARMHH